MLKQVVVTGALFGLVGCADDTTPGVRVSVGLGDRDPMHAAFARVDGGSWDEVVESTFDNGVVSFDVYFESHVSVTTRCSDVFDEPYVIIKSIALVDTSSLYFRCPRNQLPAEHRVTGTLAKPGQVGLGDWMSHPASRFELTVSSGKYDLVASSDTSLYVRHDISVTQDLRLATIDVDAMGSPLRTFRLDVPPEFADWTTENVSTYLDTPNGTFFAMIGEGESVFVPSTDVLAGGVDVEAYVAMSREGELVGDGQFVDTYNFELPRRSLTYQPTDFSIEGNEGSVTVGVDTNESSGSYVTRTVRR